MVSAPLHEKEPCPVAIVDVRYGHGGARAACVVARRWSDAETIEEKIAEVRSVMPYRPGSFYERELPCIIAVLSLVCTEFHAVAVDGYVYLDEKESPGLGGRLYRHYDSRIAVVGVAKTAYRGSSFAISVFRGSSAKPLYVTAAGMPAAEAARLVQNMHGVSRIPTLIRRAHNIAKNAG
jgi:deoxyribonuclease V